MLHVDKGGLVIDEVKKFLMDSEKTPEEEIDDIFDYIDYDKQGQINKNKLKIIMQEITGEQISDIESEEMINLLKNERGVLDKKSFRKLMDMKIEVN